MTHSIMLYGVEIWGGICTEKWGDESGQRVSYGTNIGGCTTYTRGVTAGITPIDVLAQEKKKVGEKKDKQERLQASSEKDVE